MRTARGSFVWLHLGWDIITHTFRVRYVLALIHLGWDIMLWIKAPVVPFILDKPFADHSQRDWWNLLWRGIGRNHQRCKFLQCKLSPVVIFGNDCGLSTFLVTINRAIVFAQTHNTDKWIGYQRTKRVYICLWSQRKRRWQILWYLFHKVSFQIDTDGSGSIDFDEFVKIMT